MRGGGWDNADLVYKSTPNDAASQKRESGGKHFTKQGEIKEWDKTRPMVKIRDLGYGEMDSFRESRG